jgi:hypothetical protein
LDGIGLAGRQDLSDYVITGGEGRTILTRGGKGTILSGGDGNYVELYNYNGNSDVRVLKSGTPNTAFKAPTYAPYLGKNPKTISADTIFTVAVTPTPNRVLAGNASILGDDDTNTASGLHVAAGVTLTIEVNWDSDNADDASNPSTGTFEQANLYFDDGVLLEGKIVVKHRDLTAQRDGLSPHTGDLLLQASQFVSRVGSTIDTSGDDANGGNAGEVTLKTHSYEAGTIILAASIDATGGDGDNGGTGGYVSLWTSYGTIYILGSIDSSGGNGAAGNGGNAGDLQLHPYGNYSGGTYVSAATVRARGGDGTTLGGDGGDILIDGQYNGAVVVTPAVTLDSSGGHALVNGPGGQAGSIETYADSGTLRIAGALHARGGNGFGGGNGGNGASIYFETRSSGTPSNGYSGGYGMYIGANMDASGGDGATGGDAGYVSLHDHGGADNGEAQLGTDPLLMLGYASFDASGGDGTVGGGYGGNTCYIEAQAEASDQNGNTLSSGSIVNEVAWRSDGGKGGTGTGGGAGQLSFETASSYSYPQTPNLTNTGKLSLIGGDGADGGYGGYVYLYAYGTLTNSAAISTVGGNGTVSGGGAGSLDLAGDYALINKADLTARGGDGVSSSGGSASSITLVSRFMTHAGKLDASGGASEDNVGGNGSSVEIRSTERPSTLSGSIAAAGGTSTNDNDGAPGEVFIDALQVSLSNVGSIDL